MDFNEVKYNDKKLPVATSQESAKPVRVHKPKIDLKKCEKNYNCIVFCPHNAINKNKNGFPVVDYNKCTGCLICLRECPAFAIAEESEKNEPKV